MSPAHECSAWQGFWGFPSPHGFLRHLTGACLALVAVAAFRSEGDWPRSLVSTVIRYVSEYVEGPNIDVEASELAIQLAGPALKGVCDVWGQTCIVDATGEPRPYATLLAQSCLGHGELLRLLQAARYVRAWAELREGETSDVVDWIASTRFDGFAALALDSQLAVANRLQTLASARRRLRQRGWAGSEPEDVMSRMKAGRLSATALLGCASEREAVELIALLL